MSQHSALCHDNGVRRCVANKVGCARDRGALSHMTEELCRPRQSRAHTTGIRARLGFTHDRGSSTTKVFYRYKDFFVMTDLYISQKKKKTSEN